MSTDLVKESESDGPEDSAMQSLHHINKSSDILISIAFWAAFTLLSGQ